METWLTAEYEYERPVRGQVRQGVVLNLQEHGAFIDLGLKRDGFVPRDDLDRLQQEVESQVELGQEVLARVLRIDQHENYVLVSLYQALWERDWSEAQQMLEQGDILHRAVTGYNKGGLLVSFGRLKGFVPASHLWERSKQHLPPDERMEFFQSYVGTELPLKVIEVHQERNRLILSERIARRQLRSQTMERLLSELLEGEVVTGTVSNLCSFGAFVDLGGADGLIHLSELSWHHIQHPGEVLQVGQEVRVYVLSLDHERKRIGLSLKRLQPNPWTLVEERLAGDQLVSGVVTSVVDFGAFVALDDLAVEGLLNISEIADSPPEHPAEMVQVGDKLILRVLSLDPFRQRIGLSLRRVEAWEREAWLAQTAPALST